MKKTTSILVMAAMLLTACGTSAPDTSPIDENPPVVEPQIDEPVVDEVDEPIATEEVHTAEAYEPPEEIDIEQWSYIPVYSRIDKIYLGSGMEGDIDEDIPISLDSDELAVLWQLMRVDEWEVATDWPWMLPSEFRITETANDEIYQVWFFGEYNGQLMIGPSLSNPDDEENPVTGSHKVIYVAPIEIYTDMLEFIESLML
ncbi:MAG: hypothetical protein FWH20_06525 [Oscillospiraceae bacterium]|nr:hypothetical protein [Oscillospiraceae bacterium]